ncbi:hypothetical protein [Phytohabitans houttuyneae]|uniref:hypothetical protein n=1 Tax=Phytohabitans houttuyneae TaxID=1076126 RepID=UPI001563934B|nr:hypothetical protein [Phytohabitans houttuyneae]
MRRQLQRHVDTLADTVTLRPNLAAASPKTRSDDAALARRAVATAWVYMSCVVAWAEDHDLVRPLLRRSPPGLSRTPESGAIWLVRAFQQLGAHPSTLWLIHPGYQPALWAGAPSAAASNDLIDWWAAEAPSLAYPATSTAPGSISGWPIGDLLPVVHDNLRAGNALVQTPHWVADLILDLTLIPTVDEFRDEHLIRTIDPACGTGHFLIRAIDYLWQWWTTGTLPSRSVTGRPPLAAGAVLTPVEAARRILASIDGVELDPLTAAVARLRSTIYIGHLLAAAGVLPAPLRLQAIPATVAPRIAVGDSLLLGRISRRQYEAVHPRLAALPGAAYPLDDFAWPPEPDPARPNDPR